MGGGVATSRPVGTRDDTSTLSLRGAAGDEAVSARNDEIATSRPVGTRDDNRGCGIAGRFFALLRMTG